MKRIDVVPWPAGWYFFVLAFFSGPTILPPMIDKQTPLPFETFLASARSLAARGGLEALRNPHALIGRQCRCRGCFCCAALQVYNQLRDIEEKASRLSPGESNPYPF